MPPLGILMCVPGRGTTRRSCPTHATQAPADPTVSLDRCDLPSNTGLHHDPGAGATGSMQDTPSNTGLHHDPGAGATGSMQDALGHAGLHHVPGAGATGTVRDATRSKGDTPGAHLPLVTARAPFDRPHPLPCPDRASLLVEVVETTLPRFARLDTVHDLGPVDLVGVARLQTGLPQRRNGAPVIAVRHHGVLDRVIAFDARDGRIATARVLLNPHTLRQLERELGKLVGRSSSGARHYPAKMARLVTQAREGIRPRPHDPQTRGAGGTASIEPMPFVEQRTVLVISVKRASIPVAHRRTSRRMGPDLPPQSTEASKTHRVRRDPRGELTGPAVEARARIPDGEEARITTGDICRKYPLVHRSLIPSSHEPTCTTAVHVAVERAKGGWPGVDQPLRQGPVATIATTAGYRIEMDGAWPGALAHQQVHGYPPARPSGGSSVWSSMSSPDRRPGCRRRSSRSPSGWLRW